MASASNDSVKNIHNLSHRCCNNLSVQDIERRRAKLVHKASPRPQIIDGSSTHFILDGTQLAKEQILYTYA